MSQSPDAFLIVLQGNPNQGGAALPLSKGKVTLGRASRDYQPDIPFDSPYVSRRHATIEYKDGVYLLTDLPGSRHGTWINEKRLAPGVPQEIKDRDRIGLARKEVVLTFVTAAVTASETWDYPESQPRPPVILEPERREVILDGRPVALTGKLYDLLRMLYDNWGRAVSSLDIKRAVWAERGLGADGMPLVTDEELTTLAYRLRERLKPHGDLIRTVPRYGYMLDLPPRPRPSPSEQGVE